MSDIKRWFMKKDKRDNPGVSVTEGWAGKDIQELSNESRTPPPKRFRKNVGEGRFDNEVDSTKIKSIVAPDNTGSGRIVIDISDDEFTADKVEGKHSCGFVGKSAASCSKVITDAPSTTSLIDKHKLKFSNGVSSSGSLVNRLHDWLIHWNERFLSTGAKGKANEKYKKAMILCGSPGSGASVVLVSQILGFKATEVDGADEGFQENIANFNKQMVSTEGLDRRWKIVLMVKGDDGLLRDRPRLSDFFRGIQKSTFPVVCICKDHYGVRRKVVVKRCEVLCFCNPDQH